MRRVLIAQEVRPGLEPAIVGQLACDVASEESHGVDAIPMSAE